MSQKVLLTILFFIIADAIRTTVVRSAFLNGAEVWPFLLSTALVSITLMSFTLGIKHRVELNKLITKRPKALLVVLMINAWHYGFAGTLYIVSSKYVPAPITGILIQSVILFSALWERIFFKETQDKAFWLLLAGNVTGLYLIAFSEQDVGFNIYYLIPVAAAFCFSITDNFSRYYLNKELVKPEVMAFFRPIGFILFIPILLITNNFIDLDLKFTGLFKPDLLAHILAVGATMSIVWIFINRAYKMTSVSNICMLSMSKPILILLLSSIFLDEYFNLTQSIGAAILIISSLSFIYSKNRK